MVWSLASNNLCSFLVYFPILGLNRLLWILKCDFLISLDTIWFTTRLEQMKWNRGYKRLVKKISRYFNVCHNLDQCTIYLLTHIIVSGGNPPLTMLTLYFVTSWQSAKDVESAVNSRIADYQAYIEEIAEFYKESGQHINADQDIHTVFECIESIIVNPIPRKNWQGVSLIWFERRHFAREDVHSNLSVTLSSYFKRVL